MDETCPPGSGSAGHSWLEAPPRLRAVAPWVPEPSYGRLGPAGQPWKPWSPAEAALKDAGFTTFGNPGLRFDRRWRLLGWMPRAAAAGMEPRAAARARAQVGQGRASQGTDRDDDPQRAGCLLAWRAARRGEGGTVTLTSRPRRVLTLTLTMFFSNTGRYSTLQLLACPPLVQHEPLFIKPLETQTLCLRARHTSVLGSKARAGELAGGTPVRCFVTYGAS